jgi:Flp pilus assembly pilin Flp
MSRSKNKSLVLLTPRRRARDLRAQRGQAYAEYVVIVLLVVIVLIAGNGSVMTQLLNAFKSFYAAYSYSLSMP